MYTLTFTTGTWDNACDGQSVMLAFESVEKRDSFEAALREAANVDQEGVTADEMTAARFWNLAEERRREMLRANLDTEVANRRYFPKEESISTYCGSITADELARHIRDCEPCRKEFG